MTDKKRFIFNCLLSLVLGIVIGVGAFGIKGNTSTEAVADNPGDFIDGGEFNLTPEDSSSIKLFSTTTSVTPANPSTTVKTYTVKATILPEGVTGETLEWSLAFENASSTWATGKTVTDYVTISVSSDTLTATVRCKAAFGERIILKASLVSNSKTSANVKIEYERKATAYSFYIVNSASASSPLFRLVYNPTASGTVLKNMNTVTINATGNSTGIPKVVSALDDSYTTEAEDYSLTRIILTPGNDFKYYLTGNTSFTALQLSAATCILNLSDSMVVVPFTKTWLSRMNSAGITTAKIQEAVSNLAKANKSAYTAVLYRGTKVVATIPVYFNTTVSL